MNKQSESFVYVTNWENNENELCVDYREHLEFPN